MHDGFYFSKAIFLGINYSGAAIQDDQILMQFTLRH